MKGAGASRGLRLTAATSGRGTPLEPAGAFSAGSRGANRGFRARRGFSLLDLLLSIAVMVVLLGLLMPTLSMARESTRRVVCASNARQLGLGLAMYAEDNRGFLPPTVFIRSAENSQNPEMDRTEMMALFVSSPRRSWDGLGWLYGREYLEASAVFYCPSHTGDHSFELYADRWRTQNRKIFGNYQFRGALEDGRNNLHLMPQGTALVSDGMRTREDYNHADGCNVLRADISVRWFADHAGQFAAMLPANAWDEGGDDAVGDAWLYLDGDGPE